MSQREMAARLLENVPQWKLGYVIAYIQGLIADDDADDAFCETLLEDYENDPDKGPFVSFDEVAKECGLNPNDL